MSITNGLFVKIYNILSISLFNFKYKRINNKDKPNALIGKIRILFKVFQTNKKGRREKQGNLEDITGFSLSFC